MRITPTIREALRSAYATQVKKLKPKTPDRCEMLAVSIIAELDPKDHLMLSRSSDFVRFRDVVGKIMNPNIPWND